MSNCEENNHLKYKFFTDETENTPKPKDINAIKDLTISNGDSAKQLLEQSDATDTASVDSNER